MTNIIPPPVGMKCSSYSFEPLLCAMLFQGEAENLKTVSNLPKSISHGFWQSVSLNLALENLYYQSVSNEEETGKTVH